MTRRLFLSVAGALAVTAGAAAAAPAKGADRVPQAKRIVALLARNDFKSVEQMFDPPMRSAVPEAKLRATWRGVAKQVGAYKKVIGAQRAPTSEHGRHGDTVILSCQFERGKVDMK